MSSLPYLYKTGQCPRVGDVIQASRHRGLRRVVETKDTIHEKLREEKPYFQERIGVEWASSAVGRTWVIPSNYALCVRDGWGVDDPDRPEQIIRDAREQ